MALWHHCTPQRPRFQQAAALKYAPATHRVRRGAVALHGRRAAQQRWRRHARHLLRVHEHRRRAAAAAEVAALSEAGFSKTSAQALGYKEILQHLRGEISHDEAVELVITRTRQFAVRQERWFRRDPRVRWIDIESDPVAEVAPIVIEELQRA